MMVSGSYQNAGLRRRRTARKIRWYIIIFLFLFFIIGSVLLIFKSQFLHIKHISFEGVPAGQEERILELLRSQVVKTRLGGILGTNHYLSWRDTFEYEDVRSHRVSITKNLLSRTITIIVHPRQRYGVWCLSGESGEAQCSWVDASGVAFEPAPILQGQLVMAIHETASSTEIALGVPIIKADHFAVIRKVLDSLMILNLPVGEIRVDRSLEELQLLTIAGPRISFSLRFDPSQSALPALKKLMSVSGIDNMRTIDFTVENRVFYTLQ